MAARSCDRLPNTKGAEALRWRWLGLLTSLATLAACPSRSAIDAGSPTIDAGLDPAVFCEQYGPAYCRAAIRCGSLRTIDEARCQRRASDFCLAHLGLDPGWFAFSEERASWYLHTLDAGSCFAAGYGPGFFPGALGPARLRHIFRRACDSSLCDGGSACRAQGCKEACTPYTDVGEPCAMSSCDDDVAYCPSWFTAPGSVCTAWPTDGQFCTDRCAAHWWCETSPTAPRICRAPLADDTPCNHYSNNKWQCDSGICNTNNRCGYVPLHGRCLWGGDCGSSLETICRDEDVMTLDGGWAGHCEQLLPNGASCTSNLDCKSFGCFNGRCDSKSFKTGDAGEACLYLSCAEGLACQFVAYDLPGRCRGVAPILIKRRA